jgi:hypothetical protein
LIGYPYYLQLAEEKGWFKGEDPIHARAIFNANAHDFIRKVIIDKMVG